MVEDYVRKLFRKLFSSKEDNLGIVYLWFNKFKENKMNRDKELERDLDFLDTDFYYFLRLIFSKGKISKNSLIKKRRLSEEKFSLFEDMATSKKYINSFLGNDGRTYEIANEGISYLLNFKKTMEEKSHSNWIKWATIILAISASIQAIDIWVNKDLTKNFISTKVTQIIISLFQVLGALLQLFFWIFLVFLFIKLVLYLFKKIQHK